MAARRLGSRKRRPIARDRSWGTWRAFSCVLGGELRASGRRLESGWPTGGPYPTLGCGTRQIAAWVGPSALMMFSPVRPETNQTSAPASVTNAVSPTHQPAA